MLDSTDQRTGPATLRQHPAAVQSSASLQLFQRMVGRMSILELIDRHRRTILEPVAVATYDSDDVADRSIRLAVFNKLAYLEQTIAHVVFFRTCY